jgi:2-methylfumaryl-CoA hydratase
MEVDMKAKHVERIEVGGPYFEDLKIGQIFDSAPALTLTSGHAAFHAAQFGDRLRLPLDGPLCQSVTGQAALAHPNLVCNVAIGQTTEPTQRVKGNLFYRGLVLQTPVFIGDTLRTTSEIVALRQNRPKPGRDATGLAVLQVHVENQRGDTVLHFWRCPMLPCREPDADTGARDSFDAIPAEIKADQLESAIPLDWQLDFFRRNLPGLHFADLSVGTQYRVEARDTVTSAPELARLTLNVAQVHTDANASAYQKRLVYGGHTISLAGAQITRALPNLVTLLAWRSCDHRAPVFEGDRLWTEFTIDDKQSLKRAGGIVDLHAVVHAERAEETVEVLDWRVVGLMA